MTEQTAGPPPLSAAQLTALLRAGRPGWQLAGTRPLAGATSARVTAVRATQASGREATFVVHQYGAANLRADPDAAVTEYRLLHLLAAAGLPVPRPYLADESGTIAGGPCLLQEFIDGERVDEPSDLADFTGQLAAALAALHAAGLARADVPFLPDVRVTGASPGGRTSPAAAVCAALVASWPPEPVNDPVVLHGDYWPGNTLWRDRTLVGIIDWEDAAFGDPLADLAVARQEICWLHGADAMTVFTRQYQALCPGVSLATLPLWDLRAAVRAAAFPISSWGLPSAQLTRMRTALAAFTADALSRCPDVAARLAGSAARIE